MTTSPARHPRTTPTGHPERTNLCPLPGKPVPPDGQTCAPDRADLCPIAATPVASAGRRTSPGRHTGRLLTLLAVAAMGLTACRPGSNRQPPRDAPLADSAANTHTRLSANVWQVLLPEDKQYDMEMKFEDDLCIEALTYNGHTETLSNRYRLQGDTLVLLHDKPRRYLIVELTDSTLVIRHLSDKLTLGGGEVKFRSKKADAATLPPDSTAAVAPTVVLHKLDGTPVTHPDAYRLHAAPTTNADGKRSIRLEIVNTDGPTASPGQYRLERREEGRWQEVPFVDGLVSSRPGRDLKEGDSLAGIIGNTMLEQPLANGCYRASLQLSTNLSARCTLDAEGIHPAPDDDGRERAFVLRILPSTGDSLHILLENHTNLPVQPRFLPAIGTDELLTLHPLTHTGGQAETDYMATHARLQGGQSLRVDIPATWEPAALPDASLQERFASGTLPPGEYLVRLPLLVFTHACFSIAEP